MRHGADPGVALAGVLGVAAEDILGGTPGVGLGGFAATGSSRRCCNLSVSAIYASSRNCGPPNSIPAVNLVGRLLDAALL